MATVTSRCLVENLIVPAARCFATKYRCGALLATLLAPFLAFTAAAAPPSTLTVGSRTLTLCNSADVGYCGTITRALDPSGAVAGTLKVAFEFYPRYNQSLPSLGTIVPQEGGPGYSTTGSGYFYLGVFDALRERRDILIIDKRGTGKSAAIDCPALQTGTTDLGAVEDCVTQLGAASWLYGTKFAAGDIVGVMDALALQEVDFYGDSYGTFVGQVMAALYPHRLRSLVLDSAYPVRAPDVWFPTDWATEWSSFDRSCSRSPSCYALGGSATARIKQLIAALRLKPITGKAPDAYGLSVTQTLDVSGLMRIIDNAGSGGSIYRELDAATRAYLDHADTRPLLRIAAEQDTGYDDAAADFSYGLYTAVICSDYPLLYDLKASAATRTQQYNAALASARTNRPTLFAPFTVDEALASEMYITPLDSCLPWPVPPANQIQGKPIPASAVFPAVPTLVLSGDLDGVTSSQDAAQVVAQFPNAVHVIVPNLTHVVADQDAYGCTTGIIQNFVETLATGDTSCTAKVRAVRTVPRFAKTYKELSPLTSTTGDKTSADQKRIAASALEAAGDALARYIPSFDRTQAGLRGGTFKYADTATGLSFTLSGCRFTDDVATSGSIAWNFDTSVITAKLTMTVGGVAAGTLNVRWTDGAINASATVTGTVQGVVLAARRIAP